MVLRIPDHRQTANPISVDTRVLIHAHRADAQWSDPARACLCRLADDRSTWAIPWPCIHEFLAIVAHPRIYTPPSTIEQAIDQIDAWMESPTLAIIGESDDHWSILRGQLTVGHVRGPMIHDAWVAALCIGNGVSEILAADRNFDWFPELASRNPLIVAE